MNSDRKISPDLARLLSNNGTSLEEFDEKCRRSDRDPKTIAIRERAARRKNGTLTDADRTYYENARKEDEKREAEAKAVGALWIIDDTINGEDEE